MKDSQSLVILGSTGSIGQQTLDVVSRNPDRFSIFALVAHSSVDVIFNQCQCYLPQHVVMVNPGAAKKLSERVLAAGLAVKVHSGQTAAVELVAETEVDLVMAAIVGAAGLAPTLAAAQAGKTILLANKEALVMSGELFMSTVAQCNATLLPVDSEHNAIFQCLPEGYFPGQQPPESLAAIILTASGGPFRDRDLSSFDKITVQQAVNHPNWEMGAKISVDSATMMNKGLEFIEAHYLFSLPPQQIEVLLHPESVVHSMVRYQDGSVIAQMGVSDMRIAIATAMDWPSRAMHSGAASLDFSTIQHLSFAALSDERYPCFALARQALAAGGAAIVALNAANEIAVEAFLAGKIAFLAIHQLIELVLTEFSGGLIASIDDVLYIDARAREIARQQINLLV
jgi:1-deoxy-D-xylulose-5-phosphate reductoisomerase